MSNLKNKLIIIVLLLLCSQSAFLCCEIIYLDTGKTIKGKIVQQDDHSLTIISDMAQITLKKSQIAKIEKETVEEYQKYFNHAKELINQGNEIEALNELLKTLELKKDFFEAKELALTTYTSLEKKSELKFDAGNFEECLKINEVLNKAADVILLQGNYARLRKINILRQLIVCHMKLGESLFNSTNPADKDKAIDQFEAGLKYNPQLPEFYISYANVLFSFDILPEAKDMLRKATQLNPDYTLLEKINSLSIQIDSKLNPSPTSVAANNSTTQTIAAQNIEYTQQNNAGTSATQQQLQAQLEAGEMQTTQSLIQEATPTVNIPGVTAPQKKPLSYEELPVSTRVKARIQGDNAKQTAMNVVKEIKEANYSEYITSVDYTDYIPYALFLVLFILINWVVPFQIIKVISNKYDFEATRWRPWVKKIGLIIFIGYVLSKFQYLSKFFKKSKPKNKCPYCKEPIDNLDMTLGLDFIHCPHCGKNITPIEDYEKYIKHLILNVEDLANKTGDVTNPQGVEKDAMINLINAFIIYGINQRASDLHIEPGANFVKTRYRVDGVLSDYFMLKKGTESMLSSGIKALASMDISERRRPQDGRTTISVNGVDVDVRINTSPTPYGEKVTMRMLNPKSLILSANQLGLSENDSVIFEDTIRKSFGMILVTGATGSGKSTTLYVALNMLNTGQKNIVTLEDPIEYNLDGLTQMQVNNKIDFTFSSGLRSILRQDPDIIMIGEIRDKETADIAIDAAMTGHLVFSTMHTLDSPSAFMRFKELGVDPKRALNATNLVIAQRLVRVNCEKCKIKYIPDQKDIESLGLSSSVKDVVFMKGKGCPYCRGTGYYGRTGVYEFLKIDDGIRESIGESVDTIDLRKLGKKNGMLTLKEAGLLKVMKGITTAEEVVRVVL